MTHNVVRVLGETKRVRRGTERRDGIKLNETPLVGHVRVTRQNGVMTETTHYKNRYVEGFNWVWLARRNSRTVKVENEIPVEEKVVEPKSPKTVKAPKTVKPKTVKVKKLTRMEILEKVGSGEIKPDEASKLLKEAA